MERGKYSVQGKSSAFDVGVLAMVSWERFIDYCRGTRDTATADVKCHVIDCRLRRLPRAPLRTTRLDPCRSYGHTFRPSHIVIDSSPQLQRLSAADVRTHHGWSQAEDLGLASSPPLHPDSLTTTSHHFTTQSNKETHTQCSAHSPAPRGPCVPPAPAPSPSPPFAASRATQTTLQQTPTSTRACCPTTSTA